MVASVMRLIGAVSACAVLAGCAASGKVTDFNKNTTVVQHIELSDSGKLKIYDGSAVMEVALNKIKRISVQSGDTRVYARELYCLAEIEFKDGTRIGSFNKDQQKAFVAASQYLQGEIPGGSYSVMFSHIEKVEFGD